MWADDAIRRRKRYSEYVISAFLKSLEVSNSKRSGKTTNSLFSVKTISKQKKALWALILEFVQYYNLIFIWNCAEIQGLKVMNYKDVNVMSEATNSPVQLYVSVHVWGFSTHMCCLASTQFDSAAINTLPPWSIVVGQLLTKPLLILCYTHFISYKFFTIKVLLFSRYWLHDCGAAKTGNGSTRRGKWRSPSSVT